MSAKKSPVVENNIKYSVSPIRDVLVVPPGAISTVEEESMHSHPALLVEQRIMSEVKPKSPKSISDNPSSRTTNTGNTGNNIAHITRLHFCFWRHRKFQYTYFIGKIILS